MASRISWTVASAVLAFLFTWMFSGKNAPLGIAVTLAVVATLWLLVFASRVVAAPPRIERDLRQRELELQVISQRRNIASELRTLAEAARTEAHRARKQEMDEASRTGNAPEQIHRRATELAGLATEILEFNEQRTGHLPYRDQIAGIAATVSSQHVASSDEAISQLEAFAAELDRQILSGVYW